MHLQVFKCELKIEEPIPSPINPEIQNSTNNTIDKKSEIKKMFNEFNQSSQKDGRVTPRPIKIYTPLAQNRLDTKKRSTSSHVIKNIPSTNTPYTRLYDNYYTEKNNVYNNHKKTMSDSAFSDKNKLVNKFLN